MDNYLPKMMFKRSVMIVKLLHLRLTIKQFKVVGSKSPSAFVKRQTAPVSFSFIFGRLKRTLQFFGVAT